MRELSAFVLLDGIPGTMQSKAPLSTPDPFSSAVLGLLTSVHVTIAPPLQYQDSNEE
jgi:hypothetical protein